MGVWEQALWRPEEGTVFQEGRFTYSCMYSQTPPTAFQDADWFDYKQAFVRELQFLWIHEYSCISCLEDSNSLQASLTFASFHPFLHFSPSALGKEYMCDLMLGENSTVFELQLAMSFTVLTNMHYMKTSVDVWHLH